MKSEFDKTAEIILKEAQEMLSDAEYLDNVLNQVEHMTVSEPISLGSGDRDYIKQVIVTDPEDGHEGAVIDMKFSIRDDSLIGAEPSDGWGESEEIDGYAKQLTKLVQHRTM